MGPGFVKVRESYKSRSQSRKKNRNYNSARDIHKVFFHRFYCYLAGTVRRPLLYFLLSLRLKLNSRAIKNAGGRGRERRDTGEGERDRWRPLFMSLFMGKNRKGGWKKRRGRGRKGWAPLPPF